MRKMMFAVVISVAALVSCGGDGVKYSAFRLSAKSTDGKAEIKTGSEFIVVVEGDGIDVRCALLEVKDGEIESVSPWKAAENGNATFIFGQTWGTYEIPTHTYHFNGKDYLGVEEEKVRVTLTDDGNLGEIEIGGLKGTAPEPYVEPTKKASATISGKVEGVAGTAISPSGPQLTVSFENCRLKENLDGLISDDICKGWFSTSCKNDTLDFSPTVSADRKSLSVKVSSGDPFALEKAVWWVVLPTTEVSPVEPLDEECYLPDTGIIVIGNLDDAYIEILPSET